MRTAGSWRVGVGRAGVAWAVALVAGCAAQDLPEPFYFVGGAAVRTGPAGDEDATGGEADAVGLRGSDGDTGQEDPQMSVWNSRLQALKAAYADFAPTSPSPCASDNGVSSGDDFLTLPTQLLKSNEPAVTQCPGLPEPEPDGFVSCIYGNTAVVGKECAACVAVEHLCGVMCADFWGAQCNVDLVSHCWNIVNTCWKYDLKSWSP